MKKEKLLAIRIIIFSIIMIAIVAVMQMIANAGATSEKYQALAECISQSGTKFYGAFWCPHCQEQKAEFGAAKAQLPYIECSNPDRSQNALCNAAGISKYPTWVFPDGTQISQVMSVSALAAKTGCSLPGATAQQPQAAAAL